MSKQRRYSITSSARANTAGGNVRPVALAVLRLITSSYLVDACTGRSTLFTHKDAIDVAGGPPVLVDELGPRR